MPEDLECKAECEDVFTICAVDGRGRGHCKYFPSENKSEKCFYYIEDTEHCGNAKAQIEAYKGKDSANKTSALIKNWHRNSIEYYL